MAKILDKLPKCVKDKIINVCEECPFFNDGIGYEYRVFCSVGGNPKQIYYNNMEYKTQIPVDCPLREKGTKGYHDVVHNYEGDE